MIFKDCIKELESGKREKGGALKSGIPSLGAEHLNENGSFNLQMSKMKYISNDFFKKMKKGKVRKGDIILVKDGATTGKVSFVDDEFPFEDVAVNEHVFLIRTKEEYYSKYIFYLLYSGFGKRNILNDFRGATVGGISKEFVNFNVKIPKIGEQKEIVNKLDKLQQIIDIRKKQIEGLEEIVKSQFVEMFGSKEDGFKCDTIEFNKCILSMLKGPFGSDIKKSLYVPKSNDTYKVYIQTNAIQNNQTLGDYYISKEYFDKKMYKFELKPLDYIVTCDGTIGKLLRLDNEMEKGIISSSLLKITLNEKISYKYFEEVWKQYMLGELSKSIRNACLTHLPSAKVIASLYIPFPSKELQIQYTKFVEEIDKQKFKIQKSLEQIQILQENLMGKYFN